MTNLRVFCYGRSECARIFAFSANKSVIVRLDRKEIGTLGTVGTQLRGFSQ